MTYITLNGIVNTYPSLEVIINILITRTNLLGKVDPNIRKYMQFYTLYYNLLIYKFKYKQWKYLNMKL